MNSSPIATNLKRLRADAKLSQARLAMAAGLSVSAYKAIEGGTSAPKVSTLEALARQLNVPLSRLVSPAAELQHYRFRSQKKLRTRSQILVDVGRWLADYNAVEALLGCQRPFTLSGQIGALPSDDTRAVVAARGARAALGLAPDAAIRDLCGLLEANGIKVCALPVATEGYFGLSVGPGDGGPAVVVNTWDRISVERWIFSAAHELGHLVLHLRDYDQLEATEDPHHEREANAFAAEFLMPDAVFWREWREACGLPLVPRVLKVKRIFKVSWATVLHRLAPTYAGWASNIWMQFRAEYRQTFGKALSKDEEPSGVEAAEFQPSGQAEGPASSSLRSHEPDHLSPWDFQGDRLQGLVRRAVEEGAISLARGAEILGISLLEIRARSASWVV